ncbi:hypothetical protein HMI54_010006 [Coelomomyces lativittatus]|nr:hypothetical protein HMI54_010006 [Coelomomyces lativittatus]KAJ1509912.1 hypothetical protein HMI56_006580 [Coelomomyces lativittatus]
MEFISMNIYLLLKNILSLAVFQVSLESLNSKQNFTFSISQFSKTNNYSVVQLNSYAYNTCTAACSLFGWVPTHLLFRHLKAPGWIFMYNETTDTLLGHEVKTIFFKSKNTTEPNFCLCRPSNFVCNLSEYEVTPKAYLQRWIDVLTVITGHFKDLYDLSEVDKHGKRYLTRFDTCQAILQRNINEMKEEIQRINPRKPQSYEITENFLRDILPSLTHVRLSIINIRHEILLVASLGKRFNYTPEKYTYLNTSYGIATEINFYTREKRKELIDVLEEMSSNRLLSHSASDLDNIKTVACFSS